MHFSRFVKAIRVCTVALWIISCGANSLSSARQPPGTSTVTASDTATDTTAMLAQGDRLAGAHKTDSTQLAIEKYAAALRLSEAAHDLKTQFRALSALGQAHEFLNEDDHALGYYQRAIAISLRTGAQDQMSACNNIAALHAAKGDNTVALTYARRVLQITKQVSDRQAEAQAFYTIAEATYGLGDLSQALVHYTRALEIWHQLQNRSKQAEVLIGLGYAYSNMSEPEKARASFQEAINLSKEANDLGMQAAALRGIGNFHTKQGQFQEALDRLFEAQKLLEHYDSRLLKARVIAAIGYAYENLGETDRALDYDKQATEIFHQIGNRWGEAELRWDMGHLHFMRGDYQEARKQYEHALTLFTDLKMPRMEAQTLRDLGVVHEALGNHANAIVCFKRSIALTRSGQDQRYKAYTLTYLGRVYQRLGKNAEARNLYQTALPLSQRAEDAAGEAFTLFNLARVELISGKPQQARPLIEQSLKLIEDLRNRVLSRNLRAAYVGTIHEYYQLYVDVLMQSARVDPFGDWKTLAFNASEKAHARTFLESLREGRANLVQGSDTKLIERQKALEIAVNSKAELRMKFLADKNEAAAQQVSTELNSLTSQYEQLEVEINAKNPRYAALTQPQPLTLSEIQQQVLDDDSVLLEYMLGDDRSYLWAVTRTEILSYELPPRAQIETAARNLRELLTVNQPKLNETFQQHQERVRQADAQLPAAAAALSDLLIRPVHDKLRTKRLIVVADGALHYIPFQALTVPPASGDAGSPNDRIPLLVNHEIVYQPSASALAVLLNGNTRPAPQNAIAVFANPVFEADDSRVRVRTGSDAANTQHAEVRGVFRDLGLSDDRVPALPASRDEAEAILSCAPWGTSLKALDFDASRKTVSRPELAHYRIVHFATHGFVDYEHPELSGLVLSLVDQNGQPQEGHLRLHDIYNLKLSANLVVLSACNTGLGKEIKGEGLIGLTRGFMYAGAGGVAASLWKVDDEATAELMTRFYEGMFKRGLTPSAAMREAQLWMWQQERWRAPYFWAAFIIQGRYDQVQNVGFSSSHAQTLVASAGVVSLVLLMACVAFGRRRSRAL
ncbi:MAG TPA: CHAT domain-containing tetratricopeptide repeat protein [Pyrinomonadaceae bacterium]